MLLPTMAQDLRVIIVGASGGIGSALTQALADSAQVSQIYALSRNPQPYPDPKIHPIPFDFTQSESLSDAAQHLKTTGKFDLIIIATGLLQGEGIAPEKNIRAMSHHSFAQSFMCNTIGPAMCAQAFLPLLRRDKKAVFTALSARVGSISDNRIGGWYAYRAAKAALNMVIKNLAIEYGRRFPETIIAGLHPGTVDTALSKPFQGNVPEGKLFTPEFSAKKLLDVIDGLRLRDNGSLKAWDGQTIPF